MALSEVVVRPMDDGDIGYIFETWGRSIRRLHDEVTGADFLDALRAHLRVLFEGARPRTALVAHPPGAPGVIVGWAVGQPPHFVDFVYVRAEYRQDRVATRLLEAGGYDLGQLETRGRLTPAGMAIARNHNVRVRPVF